MKRVLYIAGSGRSGSTLLDRILGQDEQFHSGGEIDLTLRLGMLDHRLCSCGVRFDDCEFWQAVQQIAPRALALPRVQQIVQYWDSILPIQKLWRLADHRTRQFLLYNAPSTLLSDLTDLYQAMLKVSGRDVLVDSSKHPMYLFFLAHAPGLEVRVVHLVRDPRAVAYSYGSSVVRDPDGRATMPHFGPIKSSLVWSGFNLMTERVVQNLRLPYMRCKYEDLAASPDRVIRDIMRFAWGSDIERNSTDALESGREVTLEKGHIVSGNPMRFQQGPVRVLEDRRWQDASGRSSRLVGTLTLPLLWRYGYSLTAGHLGRRSLVR